MADREIGPPEGLGPFGYTWYGLGTLWVHLRKRVWVNVYAVFLLFGTLGTLVSGEPAFPPLSALFELFRGCSFPFPLFDPCRPRGSMISVTYIYQFCHQRGVRAIARIILNYRDNSGYLFCLALDRLSFV
jgi:hypothetical protein